MSAIHDSHGWSLVLISTAISLHLLVGAITGANLPNLHQSFGAVTVTKAGTLMMAAGIVGWSRAGSPWHLFIAAGRTLIGSLMPLGADRRMVACGGYALQIAGSIAFILASGTSVSLLLAGVVLFGAGFDNATSLPPLIAQVEFVQEDVPRPTALIVAIAQGSYAIAPAIFGLIRELTSTAIDFAAGIGPAVFVAAAIGQCLAVGAFLLGRRQ